MKSGLVYWFGIIPAFSTTLFVADIIDTNGAIQRFDGTTGAYLGTISMPGGDRPGGLAFGTNGILFTIDFDNNTIYQFHAISGASVGAFTSSGFNAPSGIAHGADGNMYVANQGTLGNSFVTRYDGNTGSLLSTLVASGFGPSGGLAYATGITFNASGNLYVSDTNAGEISRFDGITAAYTQFVTPGNPPSPLSAPPRACLWSRWQPLCGR